MQEIQKFSYLAKDVEIIEKTVAYQGYFQIIKYQLRHKLFSGGWSHILMREVFERGRIAAALLYDPVRDQVVLNEQFRIGAMTNETSPWLIELTAGVMDEQDKTPADVIKREAIEEAGMQILDILPIYDYWPSPGGSTERVALFCAKVDASHAGGVFGLADEGEDIRVSVWDSTEAYTAVTSGQINNAATIIALQWLQLNKAKIQELWL